MDINDNLEAMAQALYDYWFVQFDFPDENGKPYKSSGGKMVWNEVLNREIPRGWSCGQLGDIIQANPTEHLNKGAVAPYIAMEALSTTRYLTDEPEKKAYAGGMKFRNKDILIARITPCLENGKTALVHDLKDKEVGFGSTEYIVIRGKLFSLPTFCICLARSKEFRPYAISKMTGTSGRRRLDYKDVEAYKLPIPPASLLCKFENWGAGVLDKMHKALVQSRILEKQRDFLLPLLMNGQVQVKPLNYRLDYGGTIGLQRHNPTPQSSFLGVLRGFCRAGYTSPQQSECSYYSARVYQTGCITIGIQPVLLCEAHCTIIAEEQKKLRLPFYACRRMMNKPN